MRSTAQSVEEYIAGLPQDRRDMITHVRQLITQHLPEGYEEGMQYGMISYFIPLDRYSSTYNNQPLSYIALASQKNYISLYLMSVYSDGEKTFREEYEKETGKKPNLGKSCLRFKTTDELALVALGKEIARYTPEEYIAFYEKARKQAA